MSPRALFLALLLLVAGLARAEETSPSPPPPASAAGILSFADDLLSGGDGFRAATEYLRLLHHYPESPEAAPALTGLGKAYAQAGRWDDAVNVFGQLLARRPGPESRLLLGSALYKGGHYGRAATVLLAPEGGEAGATLGTLAALRAGMLESLPAGARKEIAEAYGTLPRKSPGLAGTLSALLPGAGHLYCDRPRDALVSFLLNGAFILGTFEAAKRSEWAVAGILGAFELGWYTGNIVSSVNAAHKWNRREESRFFERYESSSLPSLTLFATPSGPGLALLSRW